MKSTKYRYHVLQMKIGAYEWNSTASRYGSFSDYYYLSKSNISAINLIVGSRNMIKISKNMSLKKLD